MKIGTKKALGIITFNRPDYFKEILETTRYNEVDRVYVVDASGTNIEQKTCLNENNRKLKYVISNEPLSVGKAKNKLLGAMIEDGMDHLFLQEDDVAIKKDGVFDLYIDCAKETGMWSGLNYAWHGNGNKGSLGEHLIKNDIDYDNNVGLVLTENGTAAFSYFHSNLINKMGMFDDFYDNVWEHLDHYQKCSSYKLTSFFNWFPDVKGSEDYIRDLDDGKHGGSVIRRDEKWNENMKIGADHFKKKFGFYPTNLPRATEDQVLERLNYLRDEYSV